MKLENGATAHTAFIEVPQYGDKRPEGLVLAETVTDWVTWNIYKRPDEYWIAEAGHYFPKLEDSSGARQRAEVNFGERLAIHLSANAYFGLKTKCGD